LGKVERFSVSIEAELLKLLDEYRRERGYATRSDAIRGLVRKELVEKQWEDPKAEAVGVITLVYDHHRGDLPDRLTELQHKHHKEIVSTTHIHMDRHNCLEVIIVRGKAGRIRKIANRLTAAKGVKHGRFITTTTGGTLA
jgi:CopG family nickel-responsive transcriptional regulator